jgi:hypothetical protein
VNLNNIGLAIDGDRIGFLGAFSNQEGKKPGRLLGVFDLGTLK